MVSSSSSLFVSRPDHACLMVVLVRFDELRMKAKVPRFSAWMWGGCGFDPPSLNVGQGFWRLGLSSIIFLPISMALFDYYAMGIAKLNDVEFFNDLERFLVLLFSSSESIVDKAQESLEGSLVSP
ncbi:unnamed protein product [Prunus armeniaca]